MAANRRNTRMGLEELRNDYSEQIEVLRKRLEGINRLTHRIYFNNTNTALNIALRRLKLLNEKVQRGPERSTE